MSLAKFLSVLSVILCVIDVDGHVSLTFPPARQFPIDFLNTFWTKQPCGMPRGQIKTSLVAGLPFNATWHLGYAHQGGYRIELLDSNENRVLDLTPTRDNDFYQGRTTAQWHYIEIPENATCRGCTIRLLRQVPEFAPNFQFISCADVDIVPKYSYTETCSGHGYAISGRCTCYARYWGDKCQYQDECDTDLDCNGVGHCTYSGGSNLPRKQCYCPESYFGTTCNRQNPQGMPTKSNLNLKRHVRVKLDDRVALYFKILLGSSQSQDQIEFVLRINGTSYGGLGWRPSALGPICKSWPFYPNALAVNHRSKRSSTFTITKSIDHSENFGQNPPTSSVVETFSIGSQQSQSQPIQQNHQHQPQIISSISNNQQRNPIEVIQVARPQRLQKVKSKPQKFQQEPPLPPPQPQPQPQPDQNFTPSEWAAQDPFTPMDCSDIVVGSARGSHHRIRDSYSRGRHTPLPDSLWGGRDDLLGANGWEHNGVTTLAFRRRMDSSDGPDHPVRGDMLVIWARGQQPGEAVPSPHHQLEKGNPTVSHFYSTDELKYHGLGSQRGLLYIDFTAVRK